MESIFYQYVDLNLSGIPTLECLELNCFYIDLKQSDPFENVSKLRHLELNNCSIHNVEIDFFEKFPILEKFSYAAD
jgi:hypothetical protein